MYRKQLPPELSDIPPRYEALSNLITKPGVFAAVHLLAAGFKYTGDGDTARCNECGLEISNWTLDMNPLTIHSQQKPDCPFIRSTITSSLSYISPAASLSTTAIRNTSISDKQENPPKRQKIETMGPEHLLNSLHETDSLQEVRGRTFSHWPHRTIPFSAQMIEAGFFNCNVGDRVICIYCNLVCQQWTPHTDDPCEVHKTLSPNCPYVTAKLIRPPASSIITLNGSSTTVATNNHLPTSNNLDPLRSNEIVFTAGCNPAYAELPKRHASFATWPHENLPSVDDLVRAGFFYTGTKTIVTCFYCNGSLQNWGPNDNPMIEHARWFPHCAYAKQLRVDEIYRKIQESKQAQQERARANELRDKAGSGVMSNTNVTTNSGQLLIPDESTLSRLVAARLDLPISQYLLDQNFKLSIIQRCWEDQLRSKNCDFVSDLDLYVACLVLRKQIEHIYGKEENIVIPSIKMEQIRGQKEKRNMINFTEERKKTIEREKTFRDWPHSSPSRIQMLTAGWLLDTTKSRDWVRCPYCDVEYENWQREDDPLIIHRHRSPTCPFVLSLHPMQPSSVSIKGLVEVFPGERIAKEALQPMPKFIFPSHSSYTQPPKREESFRNFPGGPPQNIEALVASGFYYTGFGTLLQCYYCAGRFNDFHQYPPNDINTEHCSRFPHCHFAQLISQERETRSTHNADLCSWCLTEPKELAVDSCNHLAICQTCANLINTCPICGEEAKAFFRLSV